MTPRRLVLSALSLAVFLGGCASATKRYEQGLELEMRGNYDAASAHYVEALQKDPQLVEARNRLELVTDHAVGQHLQDAGHFASRGDGMAAAHSFRRVDGLVGGARSVGVRVDLPADYDTQRREAFDTAIDALFAESEIAASRGQWKRGVDAARRARLQFEPSFDQRQRALDQEARVLVDWSRTELDRGHLRAAYDLSADVRALGAEPALLDDALLLMDEAIARGRIELMPLPVMAAGDDGRGRRGRDRLEYEKARAALLDLETRVNTSLGHGAFRAPTPFVVLSDPGVVRNVIQQAGMPADAYTAGALGLAVRAVGADYGAWMQLERIDATEFEVETTDRVVRTREGDEVTVRIEDGQRRLRAEAHVVVLDVHGNELTNVKVIGSATAPFRRGRADVDPATLNLHRRDVDAFDVFAQEVAEQQLRQALADELAALLGEAVLQPVVARVP